MHDGRLGLYYSQWGAYQLELDLLPGPELATQFARRQREASSWMWEPEREGACLNDHDERRLLLFCHCGADQSYRLAALTTLARTWPGWRVEWAYDGLRQLKAAAGHAVDFAATWPGDPQAGEEWCDVLVTVIDHGRTRAHLVDSAEAVIRSGAGSLGEHRSAWPTITVERYCHHRMYRGFRTAGTVSCTQQDEKSPVSRMRATSCSCHRPYGEMTT
ncbi:hypothetical protein HCN51_55820 [Nonomuraea sp. FMUSA5-5]|uniref:Uncharacterized protein n=1 Tax=Nonomuraea composti TaxID=2720023 RepID=A0ABX1BPS6_9ACTN|nr:hypothetical protein [Nonomuraea sp. FMUSA5-5]NJP98594.1 hypothetical protein [Nonomuraea sp. FMUSA5-5]